MSTNVLPSTEGQGKATASLICGIVGLFFFGPILGIIAIVMASKAEALGVKATGGKVLGWIDVIAGMLVVGYFIVATMAYHPS
jgi:hypothetical protein